MIAPKTIKYQGQLYVLAATPPADPAVSTPKQQKQYQALFDEYANKVEKEHQPIAQVWSQLEAKLKSTFPGIQDMVHRKDDFGWHCTSGESNAWKTAATKKTIK